MKWIFERALARATQFGIRGVTYFRTLGVVKNIIPAIASTNAIISAASVNEALKIVTFASQSLNVNMSYGGTDGVYTNTFVYERNVECIVCSPEAARRPVDVTKTMTLEEFMADVLAGTQFQLKSPSITASVAGNLYMQNPKSLRDALAPNLFKPMGELVQSGDILNITDPSLHSVQLALEINLV
jgi:ubiquitin-activating enzyme E1 C